MATDRKTAIHQYYEDLDDLGMNLVWSAIISDLNTPHDLIFGVFPQSEIGELYELGLEHTDKVSKRDNGKYFTPDDASNLMAEYLELLAGQNICDVCCGVGNLIISYLNLVGEDRARELLSNGRIWLYELDELALSICISRICLLYGEEYRDRIHRMNGDFLSASLPTDCRIISNPPYKDGTGGDIYLRIMEKVIDSGNPFVIVTPFSFMYSDEGMPIRLKLNSTYGRIVTFDNTPGMLFNGGKKGIFNKSSQNQVRPAITVSEGAVEDRSGFRCSSMIRFKNEERSRLLHRDVIEGFIGKQIQTIDPEHQVYVKCHPELEGIYSALYCGHYPHIGDFISDDGGEYAICVPTTCRYFTVGTVMDLNRSGKHILNFKNELDRDLIYAWLNSSFAYWHWRLMQGAITYSEKLMKGCPICLDAFTSEDTEKLYQIVQEMQQNEGKYVVYTKCKGVMQENVKFPEDYRHRLNSIILGALGFDEEIEGMFYRIVHGNTAL